MDFGTLPPEINSGRMYAGPGSGPMLAAAAAWDALATELHSTATAYGSVISGLTTGPWLGPASASMAAAAAPYLEWLRTTAIQAEQTATQARAAAAAYEAAFAMTVPPPVIAANRSLLMVLIATNLLGQNTPAIAATEAHYAEMWAQDAAAMYGYAGHSAAASALTPFTSPVPTTNPAGPANQAAAVIHAAGTSAGIQSAALMSAIPQALQSLAAPTAVSSAAAPVSVLAAIPASVDIPAASAAVGASTTSASASFTSASYSATGLAVTEQLAASEAAQGAIRGGAAGPVSGLGPMSSAAPGVGTATSVSGSMGRASMVGALSVPQAWTVTALPARLVATQLPTTSLGAAPAAAPSGAGNLFSDMAVAGMAGRALGGTTGLGRRAERVETTSRARPADPQRPAGSRVSSLAAELRELAELRDSGILTEEEFSEQKRRVLGA
ncbi:PPE family protein, SVP subgroup [Mycobacterium botniense]|uniref:Putative PPE family protein PPE32 n=1 Tax=Mycobacterium botniense TaxID=84962 RepID=A0A7I9Y362_9MYCO|nr:PPE domain-containing protein [Mycobacterium botniense]GFG76508.1 putative PPE family protein PPE32 [Mycobacterium botniense]